MASFDKRQHKSVPPKTREPEAGANGKPVGYGNPPKRTQFTRSGNPGGRRKNPPSFDFDSVLVRVMESKYGDKSIVEMIIDGQLKKALMGDASAYDRLVNGYTQAKQIERRGKQDHIADQAAAERVLGSVSDFMTATAPADSSSARTAEDPTSDE